MTETVWFSQSPKIIFFISNLFLEKCVHNSPEPINVSTGIVIIPWRPLRNQKKDRFKESDEMSEKDFEYWKDWLNKNEKSLIDEIGEVL